MRSLGIEGDGKKFIRVLNKVRQEGVVFEDANFAAAAGFAAGNGEEVCFGMKSDGVNAGGRIGEAQLELAIEIPEGDFVMATDSELVAGGVEREGDNGQSATIKLGWSGMVRPRNKQGEGGIGFAAIEGGAGSDPFTDERDLVGGKGIVILRHAVIGIVRDEAFEEFAVVGFARDDGGIFGFAGLKDGGVGVDAISAFGFFSAVAGEAFGEQDGRDVAAEIGGVKREDAEGCEKQ